MWKFVELKVNRLFVGKSNKEWNMVSLKNGNVVTNRH